MVADVGAVAGRVLDRHGTGPAPAPRYWIAWLLAVWLRTIENVALVLSLVASCEHFGAWR